MEDISDTKQSVSLNEQPNQIRKFDNGQETIIKFPEKKRTQRKQRVTGSSSGTIQARHPRNTRQRGRGFQRSFIQYRPVYKTLKKNSKNLEQSKSESDTNTESDSENLCSIKTDIPSENSANFVNSLPFIKVEQNVNNYEFLDNTVNTSQHYFSNIKMKKDNEFFNENSNQEKDIPDLSESKLHKVRKAQEDYFSLVQSFNPTELIMTYRKELDDESNSYLSKSMKKMQGISKMISDNHEYAPIFKLHNENLLLQQKQFDAFISEAKTKFSLIQLNNIQDIFKEADDIKHNFENECRLFDITYPAYGYKSNILNALNKNQVIIVSADLSYFFNVVTPVIIHSALKSHFIMSCDSNNMASEYVKDKFENIVKIPNYSNIDFATEEKMLNGLKDKDIKNFVAIINLPLKRSINVDLLLARLRDLLLQQEDSKLILLTSVFDNKRKYIHYFSQLKTFELEVPKLLIPVKTMWKKEPSQNYRDDIVCTALSILILHKTSNILTFVPNEAEALKIIAMFNNKIQELKNIKVECVLLNGNNPTSHFSYQPNSNKRIVYFASNCYEVLPIRSVQHVIDCGLKRDYIFTKEKNLDVLSTVFCSRAEARLRKSLVGIYKNGICYKMYNKENFCKGMQSFENPELLTRNPFNTLIKLFQYAPENALSVEFVEPLHDVVKCNNVKLLRNFNAVKDGKLTELGKKMVKLPLPARYSKLLLQGSDWGYGYEAVILVAYFSVDQFVFKYSKDEELQRVIDGAKLNLIQSESDALSFLSIFKTWKQNKCNKSWCDKFHIKCDTLHAVEAKILEVCQIVLNCTGEDICQIFSESNDLSVDLTRILLDCFGDQFCVFTGHYRSGYRILSSSQIAFLHPSSMLCNKENLPQFIIFNKMICTSRNFLVGITTVPPDLVLNSLTESSDKILEFDHDDIFGRTLEKKTIEPVGEKIIKKILLGKRGKKLQEIEDYIKTELKTDSLVIEPCVEKGCVDVYALESVLSSAVKMVDEILKSNVGDVINAEQVHVVTLKRGENTISLEIKCVMGAKVISVKALDSKFPDTQRKDSKMVEADTTKETYSPLKHCINLTWIRRPCSGVCYIDFTEAGFSVVRKLTGKNISILGSDVEVGVNRKLNYQLRLTNVPEDARTSDIKNALEKYVSHIEIEKLEMKFVPAFETTAKDIADIKIEIQDICEEYTDLSDFEIVVPKPKNTATIFTAYINVFCTEDLTETAECLSNVYLLKFKLDAKPVYRSISSTSKKVFTALESRLKKELTELKNELARIHSNIKDIFSFQAEEIGERDLVVLKLLSNDIQIMKQLQRTVNELLEGEVLNKNIVNDIHKLFCHGGHMWLRQLEKSKRVYILEEYHSKIIRVYGSHEHCFQVKKCIINFLEDTENEAVESINLGNDKQTRMLLKSIIKEYGVNLEIFVEQCGLRSSVLDIRSNKLLLHGSRESIDRAKSALDELSSCLESSVESSLLSGGEKCPVCAIPAFNLTFRLQHCNHLYCRECLLGLVTQANFPVQCCAENCSEDIVLDDIARILDEDDAKIKKLIHASMNDFLEKNRTDIVYCPVPDCSMFFFRKDIVENRRQCPLCRNEICFKCNVVYHYGYNCDVFQGSRKDPDYSFKVWKKTTTECKECPRCCSAIEKTAGCDHMTCTMCKAHFCWVCVREFRSAKEVYNHIPFCDKYPKW